MSVKQGIGASKEADFGEWYTQVVTKADLMDYSRVGGAMVIKPNAMFVWNTIRKFFTQKIESLGVEEVYFPLFIPESLLMKEAEHIEGFAAEVAWVDYGGDTKLGERLAIRPTSETIIYDSYSKWVRTYKELPMRFNQWCNIVRWEMKHTMPFIRTREFLWQEGHTVHASKESADKEVYEILDFYEQVFIELLAVPVMKGMKSVKEKFAGADFTTSIETYFSNGRGLQMGTSHALGQNFSRAFDIWFTDENEKKILAFQNSWGFSTRSIGALIGIHADDKGMSLPPRVARIQVMIVPIFNEKSKSKVFKYCEKVKVKLEKLGVRVGFDDSSDYSPGYKFNKYELEGIPLRIEVGGREVTEKKVSLTVRFDKSKYKMGLVGLKDVPKMLDKIQKDMFKIAKKRMNSLLVRVNDLSSLKKVIESKGVAVLDWCGKVNCEELIKDESGAKSGNITLYKKDKDLECVVCKKTAIGVVRFAKYY